MVRAWAALVLILIVSMVMGAPVYAADERGLLITPPRQYLSVDPGKPTKSSITIANITENPLDVTLSVEQFSVADYTYEYAFDSPKEKWISLEATLVTLKKTESRTISYTINPPANAKPGGHYFTIFASANLGEGRKVRTATVLYITAMGEVSKQSTIVKSSTPFISFGSELPFQVDIKNTGNTHFIAYTSGVAQGLLPFPSQKPNEVAHVILPDTIRRIDEKATAPILPGVYRFEYGYREEEGKEVREWQYLLHLPVWSIVFLAGAGWLGTLLVRKLKRRVGFKKTTDS
jgi:hypothetical protein